MIRLAALAAMALVLGGCEGSYCADASGNNCQAARDTERLQANREKMSSHFTPDAEIKRVEIERMTFGTGITVVHDDKRSVTCWVYRTEEGGYAITGGGMSCLPDWMLTAPKAPVRKSLQCDRSEVGEPCMDAYGNAWVHGRPAAKS